MTAAERAVEKRPGWIYRHMREAAAVAERTQSRASSHVLMEDGTQVEVFCVPGEYPDARVVTAATGDPLFVNVDKHTPTKPAPRWWRIF